MAISRRDAIKAGISYGSGVLKNGNDSVAYDRRLRAFPKDNTLACLQEAVAQADLEAAYAAAIDLRKLASELAMSGLYMSMEPIFAALKADALPAPEDLDEVAAIHARLCAFLKG